MRQKRTTGTLAFSLRPTLTAKALVASLIVGLAPSSSLFAAQVATQAVATDMPKTLIAPMNPSAEKIEMTLDIRKLTPAQSQATDVIQKLAGKGDAAEKVNILAYTKDLIDGYVGVVVNSGNNNSMPLWVDLKSNSVLAGPVFSRDGKNISSDMMMSYAQAESKKSDVAPATSATTSDATPATTSAVTPATTSAVTPATPATTSAVIPATPATTPVTNSALDSGALSQDEQLSNLYKDLSNGRYSTVSNPSSTGTKKVFVFFDPSCYFCHKMYEAVESSAAEFNKSDINIVYVPVAFLKQESVWQAAQIIQQGWPAMVMNEKNYNSQAELGGLPGIKDVSAAINVKANTELFGAVASMLGKPNAGTPMSIWMGKDGKMHSFGGYPPNMGVYLTEINK